MQHQPPEIISRTRSQREPEHSAAVAANTPSNPGTGPISGRLSGVAGRNPAYSALTTLLRQEAR